MGAFGVARLSERDMHRFWRTASLRDYQLRTLDGRDVEVVSPGRYNGDAGPDFREATLRIAGDLVQGDLEFHLDADDWRNHGHHHDAAYNRVILHIVLTCRPDEPTVELENGQRIPQLVLSEQMLVQGLYRAELSQAQLPFWDCPLSLEAQSCRDTTVLHAGRDRFVHKAEAFEEQLQGDSWDQVLYEGICEALGYSKNQKPFRRLAALVPIDLLFSELTQQVRDDAEIWVSAILFGAAGLLRPAEPRGVVDQEILNYLEPRRRIWESLRHVLQIRPMRPEEWQFFRLRPQNFPTRRLAALARIVVRFFHQGMLESLVAVVSDAALKPARVIAELRSRFLVEADVFWRAHYDFRSRSPLMARSPIPTLLGKNRADDLVINVVLPVLLAFARHAHNAPLQNRIFEVYSCYPALQENLITRRMRQQLYGATAPLRDNPSHRTAAFQQGLLHLFKMYCRPLSCQACLAITRLAAKPETESGTVPAPPFRGSLSVRSRKGGGRSA